jgi:DNA (cytosine-5)-methyltransferase 1
MKILNLFAGVGGNRKLWKGHQITAVEIEPKLCKVYARFNPEDTIICGDAMEYLKSNYHKFDMVWASPPCQSHSRMNYANKRATEENRCPMLLDCIKFLQTHFKGIFVVENVRPYYKPSILPSFIIGRHCFWSNKHIDFVPESYPISGIFKECTLKGKRILQDKYDIHFDDKIYLSAHNPSQVMRNCVDPLIGQFILNQITNS